MSPIEEAFVTNFVQKLRRERASFELGSESRRGKFLNRLCHDFAGVFDARYLQPLSDPEDAPSLRRLLEKLGAKKTCHVISFNDAVDGKELPLEEAIRAVMGYGLPSILICAPDALAYFEAEQEKGPPPRFLLVKHGGT
ncbi:MAG TPA: hypothetical protein VK388_16880 [Pyrinomonadaceae bacterium]|nr:hypothetical protein [Pyrinomonadaceae bacterium]